MQESAWTGQNTISEMLERIRASGLTAFAVWMAFRTIFRRR